MRQLIGILISGRGSNMAELARRLNYNNNKVTLVISNNPKAGGIKLAKNLGIPTLVINHEEFSSREEFDLALVKEFKSVGVTFVCLGGFMRILTQEFLKHLPAINIHPSLLPKFKGNKRIHERVLESGDKESGCTVHQVMETVDDENAILGQSRVQVMTHYTPQDLAARVLKAEHELYSNVAKKILENEITLVSPSM